MGPEKRNELTAFPNQPLQVGHWGYFLYDKGTHLLLEALHHLSDPSAVQVHLIGTAMEQAYEEQLHDLSRNLSVQFHGTCQPADLHVFELDLAVFPSITSESYSLTIDKARQLGLPVVVSDCGALPERIGKAGLTFRTGDAADLARCLQRILDAPEMLEAMRQNIRSGTSASLKAHVARLEQIHDDATYNSRPMEGPSILYLKLPAHVPQKAQVRERALADLRSHLAQSEQQAVHVPTAEIVAMAPVQERDPVLGEQLLRVSKLEQGISELDAEARRHRESLQAILSSKSWKLTAPLRWLRHPHCALLGKDRVATKLAYCKVTLVRTYLYYRKTGLKATARRMLAELRAMRTKLSDPPSLGLSELVNVRDIHPLPGNISGRIAVHAHVHYADVITEFASYLRNIPFAFDLFVSVSTDEARDLCNRAFSRLPQAGCVIVDVVENRGRDIAPMICHFGARLATYDYVCHVHTKKSVYTQGRMASWREYLFRQLLGSEDQVRRIFSIFEKNPSAGIIYPQNYEHLPYWGNTWLSNRVLGSQMCRQIGIKDVPEGYFDYPAGSMFWARSKAIQDLLSADIRLTDFPQEAGQTDGSLAHCVERLLVLVAKHTGYKPLILADPFSPSWSKWRFDRYMARTLDDVKAMLEGKGIKIVAFDIFDSLLIRPVIRPEIIKTIIGHRSQEMVGDDYAELRAHAEELARSRLGRDVGLEDIYAEFASLTGTSIDEVGRLCAVEEQVELNLVSPRPECIDIFNHAIGSGKRVVLVSDMFLPRRIVEKMLSNNGVVGYHALYLSSDVGVRKDTGALYRLLLEREQLAPDELLVVGDNEHSDVQVPMNLGIEVCHILRPVEIARSLPRFFRIIEWVRTKGDVNEQLMLGLVTRKLFGPICYQSFDPAGLILGGPEHIGYAVVGPVILSFCLWLMDAAKKDRIEKLYFLAREGQLLKAVYDRVAMHVEDAIPSEYLVLSRRAVMVPMIESADDIYRIAQDHDYFLNELREFVKYRYGLILTDEDLHNLYRKGLWKEEKKLELPRDILRVKPVLKELTKKIIARSRIECPGLAAYLNRVELNDVTSVAVVDVGYSATVQEKLCRFLRKPIHGYYMLTSARSRRNCSQHNSFARGYYGDQINGDESDLPSLWRRSFELEIFLSSNDPQVICYLLDKNGEPEAVFQESCEVQQTSNIRTNLHSGIMSFIDDFFWLRNSVYPELKLSAFLPAMLFEGFVENMSDSEREILSSLVLDDHYCGRGIVTLGQVPISG
jgi:FMN phosphatase YigB (HAD superfamily)